MSKPSVPHNPEVASKKNPIKPPEQKETTAKTALAKTPPKEISPYKAEEKKGPKTRVIIKYDVGFPNIVFLRGKGANLSWEKGIPLKNVKNDEWIWETDLHFTNCEFKVLINDVQYETGENHRLTCGAHVHYTPKF